MRETKSICCYCGVGCGVLIASDDTRICGVRGDPDHPANFGSLCTKGATLHLSARHDTRALYPEQREARSLARSRVSWDEALDHVAVKFSGLIRAHGPAGVTLYHLLTRRYPYGEVEPFQHPRFGEAAPPSRYRPDIPRWLDLLILKAVARDKKLRFETAEEWRLALERGEHKPVLPLARTPLAAREPLWRSLAIASVVVNLLLIYWLLLH